MGSKWMLRVLLLVGAAGLAGLGNTAAFAQTDVAGSIYGAFNGTTNGDGTTQSPANAAGALLEVRHISNPLIGYEGHILLQPGKRGLYGQRRPSAQPLDLVQLRLQRCRPMHMSWLRTGWHR